MCVPYTTLLLLPTGKIVTAIADRGINSAKAFAANGGAAVKPSSSRHSSSRIRQAPQSQSLFSRKLGFPLLPKGLDPLLGIRRSRDGSQGLRLIFQLALH